MGICFQTDGALTFPAGWRSSVGCHQVRRLPHQSREVHVTKCHACRTKTAPMSPNATHATSKAAASPATKCATGSSPVPSAMLPTQSAAVCDKVGCESVVLCGKMCRQNCVCARVVCDNGGVRVVCDNGVCSSCL